MEVARLPNAAALGLYCPCLYYVIKGSAPGCVQVVSSSSCAATNGAGAMGKYHQILLGEHLLHHDRLDAVLTVLLRRKILRTRLVSLRSA